MNIETFTTGGTMNFVARMALNRRCCPLADTLAEAIAVHQWVRGLGRDESSIAEARKEVLGHGLFFVMRKGAQAYEALISRSAWLRAKGMDGWFDAMNRAKGLILLKHDEIESVQFGAARVPIALPTPQCYAERLTRTCVVVVELKSQAALRPR